MGNQYHTKLLNTSRVIREIWLAKSISRIEISNKLDLNKSTVTNIVRDLINQNIVKIADEGVPGPKGGRKPVMLSMNRKFGYVLGFEFRPESYTAVAIDLSGEILFYKSERIHIYENKLTEIFFEVLARVEEENKRLGLPMLGIGLGLSGIVDPANNRIITSIPLHIENEFNFDEKITSRLNVPLFVDNDANCCAWGELAFHRDRELDHFIFVLIEFRDGEDISSEQDRFSVGLGLVLNGKVHYGQKALSGEFRSVFTPSTKKAQFAVEAEVHAGFDLNEELMEEFSKELSQNVALLANAFNMSHIFLGGDVDKIGKHFMSVLKTEIDRSWPYRHINANREILFSSHSDKAVAFGAAGMVLNRLFVDFDPEKGAESRFSLIIPDSTN